MITVKELFVDVFNNSLEDFTNTYIRMCSENSDTKQHRLAIKEAIKEITNTNPINNVDNWTLIATPIQEHIDLNELDTYLDMSIYKYEDIKSKGINYLKSLENLKITELLNNFNNYTLDELKTKLNTIQHIDNYGFMLSDWSEILSYNIFECNLKHICKVEFAAKIFYEMTFCGFSNSTIQEKRNEIDEQLKEIENMTECELQEHTLSLEDIEKMLKFEGYIDNKTEEEKNKELENIMISTTKDTLYNKNVEYNIFKYIMKSNEFLKL